MRNIHQRREQIMQMLLEQGTVQVTALAPLLGVSVVTVRTDLTALESQGFASRTFGGATLVRTPLQEQSVRQKSIVNSSLKERIGLGAASLVNDGDNIIVDSGTTTLTLAQHLRGMRVITVMTNGLNVAWSLADAEGVELMLVGGVLRKKSLSTLGAQAEACLNSYTFDKLFLGVDGFDLQFGLTTHHEAEASLNFKMVQRAKKVIVLTDSSKFGRISLHRIVELDRVHAVVTDAGISPEYRDGLQRLGIELIIAE